MTTRRVAIMLELDWPYKRHTDVFEGTQRYATEHGWRCEIDEFVDQTLRGLKRRDVPYDGVIARATTALAAEAKRLRLPVVNVWASSPASDAPSVLPDLDVAGRLCAEHLLDRGFRRFACLSRTHDLGHKLQTDATVRRLELAGHACPVTEAPTSAGAAKRSRRNYDVTERWVGTLEPPVGVFVYDEHAARQVIQICRNRGWSVPHDVAMVAGSNEASLCEHPQPGLTSIDLGYDRIGYEAARLLDRLMDGEARPTRPLIIPPAGLIVRASTDFFAVEDEAVAEALRFISSHIRNAIGVDDIAAAVGVSRRTLECRFREQLDRPVAAEVRRLRIELAKRRLAESDTSIAAVARESGFANASRLSEVFRRELGIAPRDYRGQCRLKGRA